MTLVYSLGSRDIDRPGIQAIHDAQEMNLALVFGAASTARSTTLDAGVIFFVFEVDSVGSYGRWEDGGRRLPFTHGYYCAERLPG